MARNRRPRIRDQELSAREGEPFAVQVIASDRNSGDTLTYEIVSGNNQGLFVIDPLTGIISRADGGAFDFETEATRYDLRVRVTDDGNPPKSRTGDVTIRITDAPDAPHEITVSNLSVDESAAGAAIGTVTVADQDDADHALIVDDARFEIVGGILKLKDGVSLDHEAGDTVAVTITASDDDGGSLSQGFTVVVNDVNEAPTGIALSGTAVDENAAGAAVGAITVGDPDDPAEPFGSHTLAVDDARFEIVGGVLKLKDGVALDHEAEAGVTVTITATDGGGLGVVETFEIAVGDVNEAPTAIDLSAASVDEATAGAVVGTVTVTDPDDPAGPFGSHTITVDDARFEVVGDTLKLKDGVALDHETAGQIAVTVTATDGDGAAVGQSFDIAVNDVNETPHTITLSNSSVAENAPGVVIGELAASDPDDPTTPFGQLAFTVDDPRFHVIGNTLRLKPGVSLDHEAGATVTVRVSAVDGGGAYSVQAFDIGVVDVNDAPSTVVLTGSQVDEATPGAAVGTVVVSDQDDPTGLFGMHDVTVDDARFEVVGGVLKLKAGVALDFADGPSVALNVTATDGGGLSVSRSYSVTVNEIDEAPILTATAIDGVAEEAPGALVAQVVVSDPDTQDGFFGPITLTVDDPRFEVDWRDIRVKDGVALDFETEPTVTLTITATDGTGLTDTQTITVNVRDVADGKTFISLDALDGDNGSLIYSSNPFDAYFGFSVSGAGDVNGDGYDDLIVGAPIATAGPEAVDEGAAYVVFGSVAGYPAEFDLAQLDGTNGFRINGTDTDYGGFGAVVSAAGDYNGDGFADILVSATPIAAPAASSGGGYPLPPPPPITNEGFVIFGKAGGWTPTVDLEGLDPADGFRMVSSTASDLFGYPSSDIGDFNGDGFDDIAIGDPGGPGGYSPEGVTYVVFGTDAGVPTDLDLDTLDGGNGFRVMGADQGDYAGFVSSAGDLNGDGFGDLAIGSVGYGDPYGGATGSVHVVFGGAGPQAPSLDLGTLDPAGGFEITGLAPASEFFPLSSAGDVNGDGFADLIVGSGYSYGGGGASYVVYGTADGFTGNVDVSALDGTNGFRIDGPDGEASGFNVAGAGDVNGDGIDDLMIASEGIEFAGSVYVMYGKDGGFSDGLDLSLVDGINGFRLDGTYAFGSAGLGMDAAGDLNGDGFSDLLLSAPFEGDSVLPTWGQAYVFYGGDLTASVGGLGTSAADILTGTAAAESLVGAQGDDLLTGNGGADVLYGGAGDDVLAVGDLSFARIDGGSGVDTLRLDGAGQSLDLTGLGNTRIQGVERINLTGSGDNAVTLSVTDLLALSDQSNTLFVIGDTGDAVNLVGDWRHDGTATVDGVAYNVIGVDGVAATLYVAVEVAVPGVVPVGVSLSNSTVDENADGAVIGTLTGLPAGGSGITADDARFEIVGDVLKLKSGQSLDHEAESTVAVTVTDTGVSQTLEIAVNDLNEAPTAIGLSDASVDEVIAGAVVGTVSVVAVSLKNQPFGMHDIVVDDARFEVVGSVLKLKDGVALDLADGDTIDLVLSATDGGGLGIDQPVTVAVNNVNEAPVLTVTAVERAAEEDAGRVVGQLSAVDPDNADAVYGGPFYAVDDARFEVSARGLRLKDGIALDFETEQTVTLTVTATDEFGLSDSQTVTFDVFDVLEGSAFFTLDSALEPDLTTLFDPDPGNAVLGYSVSDAGDVNGDGYADIIIGAPFATAGLEADSEGAAYVVFGSAAGLPSNLDLSQLDGTNGFRLDGTDFDFGGLGAEVSGAGDFNGDGYDDILVGARSGARLDYPDPFNRPPPIDPPFQGPNESFVVYGKADGWTGTVDLETLDAADGFRMFNDTASFRPGHFIAELGDFNGDGYADIAVGDASGSGANEISYVLFGGDAGWPTDFDLATLDGSNGFRISGLTGEAIFGFARSAGDLNADGYDDAVIGRTVISTSNDLTGRAHIIFGGPDGHTPVLDLDQLDPGAGFEIAGLETSFTVNAVESVGDINGDGHDDLVVTTLNSNTRETDAYILYGSAAGFSGTVDVSTLDGVDGVRIGGLDGRPWSGGVEPFYGASVSGAGDVNGDGIDDLIVGIPSDGTMGPGAAYVLYGQDGGLPNGFDVTLVDGFNGFRLDGVLDGSGAGYAVSGAGDIDGDGFHDLLIGVPWTNDTGGPYQNFFGNPYPGEAHLFYGGNLNNAVTGLGTAAADTLTGTVAADSLVGAQGDDLLIGNGGADVLYGGAGNDVLAVGDLSFTRIDGGSGVDTLRLDGAGQSLDLTGLGNSVIQGVERIDLTGTGNNSANLGITDLLQISDESNELFVTGDAGDRVTLDGIWRLDGPATVDGSTYNVFAADGVTAALYVDEAVVVSSPMQVAIDLSNTLVDENASGAEIGTLSATDPVNPAAQFGFAVDDNRFEVVGGILKLKDGIALDFESEPTVSLTVTASDAAGPVKSDTVTLDVRDIYEPEAAVSVDGLNGTNGFQLFAADSGSLGVSIAGAGDVNGDGFDDVIVGAPDNIGGGTAGAPAGASYLLFGGVSGWPAEVDLALLDGTDGFRIDPGATLSGSGVSVAAAGDVNGDGVDDLIIGAVPISAAAAGGGGPPPPPPPPTGAAVVFGKTTGWSATLDLSTLSGAEGFVVPGDSINERFGGFTGSVGDMNGDGYDDVVIGDFNAGIGADRSGSSYVLFGKSTGWPAEFDESMLDGSDGFRVDGVVLDGRAGRVGPGGDFNGDGYDDLFIGALAGAGGSGSAYVVFGQPGAASPSFALSSLDGANGLEITGLESNGSLPSIGSAGDVNGDGIEDLIIGVGSGGGYSGTAFVVFGQAAGWPATLDVSALDGTVGFRIDGTASALAGYSVGSAGDVNADGFDDVIIGAPQAGVSGAAYIVYGQGGGFAPTFDLAQIDGLNGFRVDGIDGDFFSSAGLAAGGAGDVNGDGFADITLGAPEVKQGDNSFAGEGYVVFGGDFTRSVTGMGTEGSDLLTGTAAADSLVGAQGDDVLDGNGGADVLYGGAGNDILSVDDLSFARIDGGSGDDTLRLDGAGQALDLTATGDTTIEGVERVDLAGSGDNTMSLAVTDLLQISDESNDLFVSGDAGDQVTVVGDWQNAGPATVDGVTYDVFTVAGVEAALYVEDDVTVTVATTTGV